MTHSVTRAKAMLWMVPGEGAARRPGAGPRPIDELAAREVMCRRDVPCLEDDVGDDRVCEVVLEAGESVVAALRGVEA